jgi:hypothetical protein
LIGGVCWYLSAAGASCDQTCETREGFDPAATAVVGTTTQGGSPVQCGELLTALGAIGAGDPIGDGARDDGVGVGCHLFGIEQDPWWLNAPNFSADVSLPNTRIVCGCNG